MFCNFDDGVPFTIPAGFRDSSPLRIFDSMYVATAWGLQEAIAEPIPTTRIRLGPRVSTRTDEVRDRNRKGLGHLLTFAFLFKKKNVTRMGGPFLLEKTGESNEGKDDDAFTQTGGSM